MSKTSQYALDIQEQANELGYSTIQEALDDGYEVLEDTLVKIDSPDALSELEKAHEAWVKERDELLGDLNQLMLGMMASGKTVDTDTDMAVVHRAWHFIKEKSHD